MRRTYEVNEQTVVRRCRKHQYIQCVWCMNHRAFDAPGAVWVWAPVTSTAHESSNNALFGPPRQPETESDTNGD